MLRSFRDAARVIRSAGRRFVDSPRNGTTSGSRLTLERLEPRVVLNSGPLVISEFMAVNDSTLADQDGDFSDWVEVYNPTNAAVNLDGWHLTDEDNDRTKWEFPAKTLDPGEYLVVFASAKDRSFAGSELHTNFKLSSSGEYLALIQPDGLTVSHSYGLRYPDQYADISYGITQDVSTFLSANATAAYRIPTSGDAPLGTGWTEPGFDESGWTAGAETGIGYNRNSTGFEVSYYKASIAVDNLAEAEGVIATPSQQSFVVNEVADTINYYNTGGGGRYGGDSPFPGTTIGNDVNDFVIEATATVVIPRAGQWTFGVNSDDGFGLQLTNGVDTFSSSYPNPRGTADTFGTFNMQPGAYELRLVMFERGGGSAVELFAAEGSYSAFNSSAFRLVGDADGGGLLVTGFGGYLGTDVENQMADTNASLLMRVPFNVSNPATLDGLQLDMMYNDGFVA